MSPDDVPPDAPRIDLGDGYSLRGASVVATPHAAGRRRGAGAGGLDAGRTVEAALAGASMTEVKQFEIGPGEGAAAPPARRRGAAEEPRGATVVELEAPEPAAGLGQVVLAVDQETGVLTWHVAETATPGGTRRRGAASGGRVYRIRFDSAPVDDGPHRRGGRRGIAGAIAKKLIRVLIFPVTDLVLGPLEKFIALKWEDGHAPYVSRTFTPDNYATEVRDQLTPEQWKSMSAGRALLFLHGTFSSAHGAFSLLKPEHLRAFHAAYGGRVFAFNHHTVGHDPFENVRRFCASLPTEAKLDLDIICHSRGGLVSRCFAAAEALGGAGRVKVSRLCFVAAPNDGTALADAANMTHMLDRYTNFTRFLPDGPVEVAAELVVTAVKALAHAGLKYLPGLVAQSPGSEFLQQLRAMSPGGAQFYALAADFEPSAKEWKALVKEVVENQIMDQVFQQAENDLVVPTLGVAGATGPGFAVPAERSFTFAADAGVIHTDFFGNATTVAKLMEWLGVQPV